VQLWTANLGERTLRLQASHLAPGSAEVPLPTTIAFGEGVAGRVADTKLPIYVHDVSLDGRTLSADWARQTGISRMLSVPILAGDEVLGVLSVRSSTDELSTDEHRALAIWPAAPRWPCRTPAPTTTPCGVPVACATWWPSAARSPPRSTPATS
jgi:hypothetical protein